MAKVGRMVKESSVQEITNRLSERPNFFVTSIGRLPASEADVFRQKLFASKANLVMVKRRLGRRVVDGLKVTGLAELLEGSIGLILAGDDPLVIAKLIMDFRKAHEEQLSVRGAVIDGQLIDATHVEQLAKLPSRPVLLAEVVATLESPMADVIFTIERLIGDVAWLAEQAAASKPMPATPAPTEASAAQPAAAAEAGPASSPPAEPDAEQTPPTGGTTGQAETPPPAAPPAA